MTARSVAGLWEVNAQLLCLGSHNRQVQDSVCNGHNAVSMAQGHWQTNWDSSWWYEFNDEFRKMHSSAKLGKLSGPVCTQNMNWFAGADCVGCLTPHEVRAE